MMISPSHRFRNLALYGQMHSARWLLATAETLWAITLFWPGDTFDRPTYSQMSLLLPELGWAALFGIMAACQWFILLSGRYHTRSAIAFAFWNQMLWWYVVVSMYVSVYPPPAAISGELALALGASWVYLRSGFGTKGRRADDRC